MGLSRDFRINQISALANMVAEEDNNVEDMELPPLSEPHTQNEDDADIENDIGDSGNSDDSND